MYDNNIMTLKDMQAFLGLGRSRCLRLCQEHTHGFPAVKVGNRYQTERDRLARWKDDWYAGKFTI